MCEYIKQYIKILREWKNRPNQKQITDTLKRINALSYHHESEATLSPVKECLTQFHKQINQQSKNNEINVDKQWFQLTMRGKKHIEALIKKILGPKFSQRPIDPKVSIEVPSMIQQKEISSNLQYSIIFELLYKSFYAHMAEIYYQQEQNKSKVVSFLDKVIIELFKQCKIQFKTANKQQKNMARLFDLLEYIVRQFKEKQTKMSKQEMIWGTISPIQVAKGYPAIYDLQQARSRRNSRLRKYD